MKPSDLQRAALFLAVSDGYVRPASATHAHRCRTTSGRLSKAAQICQRQGWLKPISDGRYTITEEGAKFVPSTPVVADDEAVF